MKLNTLLLPIILFGFVASTLPMQQENKEINNAPLTSEEIKVLRTILEERRVKEEEIKAWEAGAPTREKQEKTATQLGFLIFGIGAIVYGSLIAMQHYGIIKHLPGC